VSYGVATMNRLLQIIGLFCRVSFLLQGSFAEETYDFKEPTNRSHPVLRGVVVIFFHIFGVCGFVCAHTYTRTHTQTHTHTATHNHAHTHTDVAGKQLDCRCFENKLFATHRTTLQNTTTHCNTSQHAAAHCNAP